MTTPTEAKRDPLGRIFLAMDQIYIRSLLCRGLEREPHPVLHWLMIHFKDPCHEAAYRAGLTSVKPVSALGPDDLVGK